MKARELVQKAIEARGRAYAPYSRYPVGAAVLTLDGRVFTGCNVENASFGLTICAERTAIVKAISEGEHAVQAVAVVAEGGAAMCGACRQVLREFGPNAEVYLADPEGNFQPATLAKLLPGAFSGLNLKRNGS
jgi:cytidine deaminase